MKKLHKIVMLATDKAVTQDTIISLNKGKLFGYLSKFQLNETFTSSPVYKNENPGGYRAIDYIEQHLYILSDDKIEKGDHIIYNNKIYSNWRFDKVSKAYICLTKGHSVYTKDCKKIIVTTDKSIKEDYCGNYSLDNHRLLKPYSKIPQQFIDYYITEYNKGNIITNVEIEYEIDKQKSNLCMGECGICDNSCNIVYKLLITKDNTINISIPSNKMYSREELKVLFDSYGDNIAAKIIWKDIENL